MASADFVIKSGDTQPILTDTLTLSDGSIPNLTGATIAFVMRSLQSAAPVVLTGVATITSIPAGTVQYVFTAQDTASWGEYQASWVVTLAGGAIMTFPTSGYLTILIEQALATATQQLVSIPDCKDVLNIPANDRSHDTKILRFLQGVQPIIEDLTGPIIMQRFEEWHDGGSDLIQLWRAPSTAFGTTPVLQLIAASEYRGPIEYPLQIIASPVFGSIYSVFLNADMGTITRRTAGGRTIAFMPGRESVHVIYEAGQSSVPPNVYEGTLEIVRDFYQKTQQAGPAGWGRGNEGADDDAPISAPVGFLIAGKVREWLGPNRRYPSFA